MYARLYHYGSLSGSIDYAFLNQTTQSWKRCIHVCAHLRQSSLCVALQHVVVSGLMTNQQTLAL